jgi:hypothetical protein
MTLHQFFASPQQVFIGDDAAGSEVRINQNGGPDGLLFIGSDANLVSSRFNVETGSEIEIEAGATLDIQLGSTFIADSVSLPRGRRAYSSSQANSAAIGVETAVLTTGGFVARDGRAYRFVFSGGVAGSVANTSTFRVRKNTSAGALVAGAFNFPTTSGSAQSLGAEFIGTNTTGADLASYNVCLTLQASAGTSTQNGSATHPRYIHVEDIGAATSFTNSIPLT